MRTRAIRSLTSLAGCAAFLVASSAGAANYTLVGKFTSNRGKGAQVPLVGLTPAAGALNNCGGLQFMSGPGVPGVTTPPPTMNVGINERNGMDLGCVPAAQVVVGGIGVGKKVVTTGMGVGGQFTIPTVAFLNPGPMTTINAIGVATIPGVLQFATNNSVTGPPAARLEAPMGTMNTGMNTAVFRRFKQGAHATQTGRAAPKFTWCPPAAPFTGPGGACTKIGQGGLPEIIKYNGTSTSFGGTISYLTHQIAPGSLIQAQGALGVVVPFGTVGQNGMAATLATGRGYAEFHVDMLLAASIFLTHMEMTVPRPIIGSQKLVTMLGAGPIAMGPVGIANNWGFPATTRTILVRNTGTLGGNPHNTTFTQKGYDCVNAKGPACSVATGMNFRNISLVAGAVGVGVLPLPTGNVPTIAMANYWLPEPGATLQMVSGVIALLGIAAWRSRRSR